MLGNMLNDLAEAIRRWTEKKCTSTCQVLKGLWQPTVRAMGILVVINSSLDATYRYLSSLVDDSPSASVSAILCQLGSLSTTLTT